MRPLLLIPLATVIGFALGSVLKHLRQQHSATPAAASSPIPTHPVAAANPKIASTPLSERLTAVIDKRSPLETARRLLAVIDSLTIDDFPKAGANPDISALPVAAQFSFREDFAEVCLDALVQRWLEVDPNAATTIWQNLSVNLEEYCYALARLRPEFALQQPYNVEETQRAVTVAFETVARRDLSAARRYAEKISDADFRGSIDTQIAKVVAESDPMAGVALAHSLNDNWVFSAALKTAMATGGDAVQQVMQAGQGKFQVTTTSGAILYPEVDRDLWEGAGGLSPDLSMYLEARKYTPEKRAATLATIDQFPRDTRRDTAVCLLRAWMLEDAPTAMDWALSYAQSPPPEPEPSTVPSDSADGLVDKEVPAPERAVPFLQTLTMWANDQPDAAIHWLESQTPSPIIAEARSKIAADLATAGLVDEAARLLPSDGKPTEPYWAAVVTTARAMAERDSPRAEQWFDTLPEQAKASATDRLVASWYIKAPSIAAAWLQRLPPGANRDRAIRSFAIRAVLDEPDAATAWIAEISHQSTRETTAERAFRSFANYDPLAAREWIRDIPDLRHSRVESLLRDPYDDRVISVSEESRLPPSDLQ